MPNTFAYLMLFSWPLVVILLLYRYQAHRAIFFAITLSWLFLPSNFDIDLPLLPPLNRETITSLSLVCMLFLSGKKFRFFQPGLITKFLIGYLAVLVISVELNPDSIINGSKLLPGLTHYDAFSNVLRMLLWMVPFFLGRYFFNNVKDNEGIFKSLVVISLIYTLPMLLEIKISPQLHRMVYGYHASDFIQNMREGGFRPTVFVGHGLSLAFWLSTCVTAAFALQKNKIRATIFSPLMILCYLSAILVLCKTWSALIYVILAALFIYKTSPTKQVKWSFILAALVLLYPATKIVGIFPDQEIVSTISEYNTERAASMQTRFYNEEVLLNHALKKAYFGWGGWGRNRLYDNYGKDIVITDGKWILEFGTGGGLGFLFYYAILLTPLYYAVKSVKYIEKTKDQVYFASLATILAVCVIDSIPNTGMASMHLFLAGALLGQAELLNKLKYSMSKKDGK